MKESEKMAEDAERVARTAEAQKAAGREYHARLTAHAENLARKALVEAEKERKAE